MVCANRFARFGPIFAIFCLQCDFLWVGGVAALLDNFAAYLVNLRQLAMLFNLLVLVPVILLLVIEKPLLFGTAAVRSTRR